MDRERLENGAEKSFGDLARHIVGFYNGWNDFEESQGPKQRQEVIDLNVAPLGSGLNFETRIQVRNYCEGLLQRIRFNPRLPQPEKEYLDAKLNASLAYLTALGATTLGGRRPDFHQYVYETLGVRPREFEDGEIENLKAKVVEDLASLGYEGFFDEAIKKFREENLLCESEICEGIRLSAEKFLPCIGKYTEVNVVPDYKIVPVRVNAPWRGWLRTLNGEIILEINLTHPEGYVRGEEEKLGIHEVPLHGLQIASWKESSRLGIISPASCVTTLHTPEQISTEGIATSLPHILKEVLPISPYGKLALSLDSLERAVLHNAHMRYNLLPSWASREEKRKHINYVAEHLPYMHWGDIKDRLKRRYESVLDRGYELSYSEGARLHFDLFDELGKNSELFRQLIEEEFRRPMTAEQIRKFARQLGAGKINSSDFISREQSPSQTVA